MPKAYWVVHVNVTNPETYEAYRAANAAALDKYGAKFLVRGGEQEDREGTNHPRTIVLEFADLDTARACYESPEYQAAKAIRLSASEGDLVIVQGYDG